MISFTLVWWSWYIQCFEKKETRWIEYIPFLKDMGCSPLICSPIPDMPVWSITNAYTYAQHFFKRFMTAFSSTVNFELFIYYYSVFCSRACDFRFASSKKVTKVKKKMRPQYVSRMWRYFTVGFFFVHALIEIDCMLWRRFCPNVSTTFFKLSHRRRRRGSSCSHSCSWSRIVWTRQTMMHSSSPA